MCSFSSFRYACCSSYKIIIFCYINVLLLIIIIYLRDVWLFVHELSHQSLLFVYPSFDYSFLFLSLCCLNVSFFLLFIMTKINYQFWWPPHLIFLLCLYDTMDLSFCEKMYLFYLFCVFGFFFSSLTKSKKMFIRFFLHNKCIFFFFMFVVVAHTSLFLSLSLAFYDKNSLQNVFFWLICPFFSSFGSVMIIRSFSSI